MQDVCSRTISDRKLTLFKTFFIGRPIHKLKKFRTFALDKSFPKRETFLRPKLKKFSKTDNFPHTKVLQSGLLTTTEDLNDEQTIKQN